MKDVLKDVDIWRERGDAIALATVISVKRSAPRPPGSKMAVNEHGEISGAVSGGCVEGAVVVILSDGWDRGDPDLLAEEMARLSRTAHRLLWLNPLAADPRYEPLTRGMQAAMPHVDHLLPGNSIASLEALAELMEGVT